MNRQVRKPEHIFDRAREWERLVRFATADSPGVRLGIVSGRRRRGKTYLLAVKGWDTTGARLTCYSGAGFDAELVDRAAGDPLIQLVGLEELYA